MEQPEADCDAGEAPDADAPVEQPAFVSPPERWVSIVLLTVVLFAFLS